MKTATFAPGDKVIILDAFGGESESVALSDVEKDGHSFPVVWVERPCGDGRVERAPWPVESVRPAR